MKEFFRFFKIPFIIVGVLAVITIVVGATHAISASNTDQSVNMGRATTERVFDYADVLTDEEEDLLRDQIRTSEGLTQCDIVIVTLNESLVEYAASYEDIIGPVPIDQCVMVYADNFYDENRFGYNEPYGDGVLFLDNWYRESDGGVYSWMSTSGKAEDIYSSSMIDHVLDVSLAYVEDDPYDAYSTFIHMFVEDITQEDRLGAIGSSFSILHILVFAVIVSVIFLVVNWSGRKGKKTVTNLTYVNGGKPTLNHKEDRFITKTVSKKKIESSSSGGRSGGGGHHRSSSGRSHGGGGHRR